MRRFSVVFGIYSLMAARAQSPFVEAVKQAATNGNFALAQQELAQWKASRGVTSEYLEAFSWIGRGQLAAKNYEEARKSAAEVRKDVLAFKGQKKLDMDAHLPIALGASIEVTGQALAAQGSRDQAVQFLNEELKRWRGTSMEARIHKNLNLLTLEGKPAPPLEHSARIGPNHVQTLNEMRGHPVLLFFWAHWCADCKVEVAFVRKLNEAFASKGLFVVAPTRRYGYVAGGEEAAPDQETKYIGEVWNKYYSRLGPAQVPLSDNNFLTYGVSTTPTLVLLDKAGIVRLYRPGKITFEELSARVEKLL